MRLLRRLEVRLHTKVDLQITAFEPTPASTCEMRRLRYLGYLEQRFVEIHRVGLAPGWHGELHVIDARDLHAPILTGREIDGQSAAMTRAGIGSWPRLPGIGG